MIGQESEFKELLETIRNKTCNSTLIIKNVNDAKIKQIAEAIPENSNLVSLTLHGTDLGNQLIGSIVVDAMVSVTDISDRSNVENFAMRRIAETGKMDQTTIAGLVKALLVRTALQAFRLENLSITTEGMEAIATLARNSDTLQALYLGSTSALSILSPRNWIGEKGVTILSKALKKNPNSILRTLHLGSITFGKEEAEMLANTLCEIPTFEDFGLFSCVIGNVGVRPLLPLVQRSHSLRSLSLVFLRREHNRINDDDAIILINGITQNPNSNLRILNLGNNHIGHKGMLAVAGFLKRNPTLETLCLNLNSFGERLDKTFFKFLIDTFIAPIVAPVESVLKRDIIDKKEHYEATGIAELAEALRSNKTLTVLDLSKNELRDEDAKKLARVLPYNSGLVTLNLSNTFIGTPGAVELLNSLTHDLFRKTPLINIDLNNEILRDMYKINPDIKQKIDSILKFKRETPPTLNSQSSDNFVHTADNPMLTGDRKEPDSKLVVTAYEHSLGSPPTVNKGTIAVLPPEESRRNKY